MPFNNILLDNEAFRLMSHRAGYTTDEMRLSNYPYQAPIDGITDQVSQLNANGGFPQQARMIKDKRRSLDKALLYSYQAAFIKNIEYEDDNTVMPVRALINPDNLKQDYDYKIVSIPFENDFHCGDIFEWVGTNTRWLIYLQELTELAYFRGNITKCQYYIQFSEDEKTYCSVRGPVETKIDYIQKHGVSVDNPNFSLTIMMPRNETTLKYFKRYAKFYLRPLESGDTNICWRVEAVDAISTPGILEIHAVEYYANEFEDNTDKGIVGTLIEEEVNPNSEETEAAIVGETFIKPKKTYTYHFSGALVSKWKVEAKGSKMSVNQTDDYTINITWLSSYSGQFTISYGSYEKTVVVESLF